MVDLGMKPIDALKAGTSSDAKLLGIADRTGTLEVEQTRRRRRRPRRSNAKHSRHRTRPLRHERRHRLQKRSQVGHGAAVPVFHFVQRVCVRAQHRCAPAWQAFNRDRDLLFHCLPMSLTQGGVMPELSETVNSGFANYYEQLRVNLHTWVASLTEEQFWKNPFPYGNSVGHLVLHLTGNLNYYIGAQIAQTGYVRDRPREFAETKPPTKLEALSGFRQSDGNGESHNPQTIRRRLERALLRLRRHLRKSLRHHARLRRPRRPPHRPNPKPGPRIRPLSKLCPGTIMYGRSTAAPHVRKMEAPSSTVFSGFLNLGFLRFQLKSRRRQPVQPSPHKPIDQHHHDRHDQRRRQQHIELSAVTRAADRATQPRRRNNVSLKMKIFRNDARVPSAAGRRNHSGHEIRKNRRQDHDSASDPSFRI